MSKVFISYSTADRELAKRLHDDLRDHGATVYQFEESAKPGSDAWDQVLTAIDESDFFVVLLTPEAVKSNAVREEISHAKYRNINHNAPILIPAKVRSVETPTALARLTELSFKRYDKGFRQLLKRVLLKVGDDIGDDDNPDKNLKRTSLVIVVIALLGILGVFGFQRQQEKAAEEKEKQIAAEQAAEAERQRIAAEDERQRLEALNIPAMVTIEAGSYRRGSDSGERDEQPVREVAIESFRLSITEVTFAQYITFATETVRAIPDDMGWGRENQPVINVRWNDAKAYTEWLSQRTGQSYRLPTEAEWEYSARAGSTSAYSWGNEVGIGKANCEGCGSPWDDKQAAPVGRFAPNAFGLYDMHGNVAEWTQDCYEENYNNTPIDGSARDTLGECEMRVVRGGSYKNIAEDIRASKRGRHEPDGSDPGAGFRLAQDL